MTDTDKLPMARRIRRRREELGLSASDLARQAGITPAYVSVIESGDRIPSEEVAVRLAQVLCDDQELYLAWAQTRDVKDLPGHLRRLNRLLRFRSVSKEPVEDRSLENTIADAESVCTAPLEQRPLENRIETDPGRVFLESDRSSRITRASERKQKHLLLDQEYLLNQDPPPSATLIPVPVLKDGCDPGGDPMNAEGVEEILQLPDSLLPLDLVGPFAYRVGEEAVSRVSEEIAAGSLVILTTRPGTLDPRYVQAVRYKERVILSRVIFHPGALVLLHDSSSREVKMLRVESREQVIKRIAGTVVLVLKYWREQRTLREKVPKPKDSLDDMPLSAVTLGSAVEKRFKRNIDRLPDESLLAWSGPTGPGRPRKARVEGGFLVRDCSWSEKYGWRPIQKAEDMDYLDDHPGMKIRFNLLKDGNVSYRLEMTPDQWREALGSYYLGRTWRPNGYIVAVTKRKKGHYTEEFQERWAQWVKKV